MPDQFAIAYCPCSSQDSYDNCCQPYHVGARAPTPEALMRSRFSGFVLKLTDYLCASWHTSSRPETLDLDDSPDWTSLRILSSHQTGDSGQVHFQAIYKQGPGWGYLEEKSQFVRENDRWFYLRGITHEGILKPGRNEPCPCGSGRKFKVCCV